MFEKVKEKLLQYSDYPVEKITKDTEIVKDLQIDSLNLMIIIGDYEEEYSIHFEIDELKDVTTVGEFVNLLETKVNN